MLQVWVARGLAQGRVWGATPPPDTRLEVPERPGSPSTFPCLHSAQLPTKAAASFLLLLPTALWAFTQKGAS